MEKPMPARALRILVVDDWPDAAESLRVLLHLWGHDVQIAGNGPEALRLAADFQPQVALLDLQMPHMDGGELGRRLRQLPGLERLLLIATTASDLDDNRMNPYRHPFSIHLRKPYQLEHLERLLAAYGTLVHP